MKPMISTRCNSVYLFIYVMNIILSYLSFVPSDGEKVGEWYEAEVTAVNARRKELTCTVYIGNIAVHYKFKSLQ